MPRLIMRTKALSMARVRRWNAITWIVQTMTTQTRRTRKLGLLQRPPPSGYAYVQEPPSLASDDDLKKLVGRQVLHAFDTDEIRGWFIGRIAARGVSNRDMQNTPSANFVVTYDRKMTKNRMLHGRVASTLTVDRYGPKEWWILLDKL